MSKIDQWALVKGNTVIEIFHTEYMANQMLQKFQCVGLKNYRVAKLKDLFDAKEQAEDVR